jgi:hypothetical protein
MYGRRKDPSMSSTVVEIFTVVFILLGFFNVSVGRRHMREGRARGQQIRWYKQVNLLTGLEYFLLSLIFAVSIDKNVIPAPLQGFIAPFFVIVLIFAAILAGFVIKQAIANGRQSRRKAPAQGQNPTSKNGSATQIYSTTAEDELTSEERSINVQRRRERHQKTAASRRRRTGRA